MARFLKDRSKAKGQAPGSLIFIGKQKMEQATIQLIEYDTDNLVEKEIAEISELESCKSSKKVSWININGLHDSELIKKISELFDIPSLFLEDVLNTGQVPKYNAGSDFDGFILKMLDYNADTRKIAAEQLTIYLTGNVVITFQERKGDVFEPVRERIRQGKGKARKKGNDYLAYILLDTVVDNYLNLVETIGRQIESLEQIVFKKTDNSVIESIFYYKTEISFLRQTIRPVKDFMYRLQMSDENMFHDENHHYLRDLNELVSQTTDAIELYSGMISDYLNIYSSVVSNRMNEVMKVLTIFASLFIPLTFVAGIYGMNFDNIPELHFVNGYLYFWIIIVALATGLVIYFKRKKWM